MAASTLLIVRVLALGGAGLVTFYVAAQWPRTDSEPVGGDDIVLPAAPASAPVSAQPQAAASAPAPAGASIPAPAASRALPSADGQAFARLKWLAPPPPPPAPTPAPAPAPAAPTAPPLPFSFVGMVENGMGKPQAFLSKGDALLVVSAGELLENNTYRVDSFDANQVVITYLPLAIKQTIDVSGGAK
jgi:hypothetical protein